MKEIKAYQQKRKGSNRRVLDTTHKTTRLNMESNCIQWVNIDIITAPPPPHPKPHGQKAHVQSTHAVSPTCLGLRGMAVASQRNPAVVLLVVGTSCRQADNTKRCSYTPKHTIELKGVLNPKRNIFGIEIITCPKLVQGLHVICNALHESHQSLKSVSNKHKVLGGLLGPHFVQETGIRTARFSVVCSEARDPSIVRPGTTGHIAIGPVVLVELEPCLWNIKSK